MGVVLTCFSILSVFFIVKLKMWCEGFLDEPRLHEICENVFFPSGREKFSGTFYFVTQTDWV